MTAIACAPGGQSDQEQWFASLLSATPTIVRAGDTLTVASGDTEVVLIEQ